VDSATIAETAIAYRQDSAIAWRRDRAPFNERAAPESTDRSDEWADMIGEMHDAGDDVIQFDLGVLAWRGQDVEPRPRFSRERLPQRRPFLVRDAMRVQLTVQSALDHGSRSPRPHRFNSDKPY
jgi:hypothetical protein